MEHLVLILFLLVILLLLFALGPKLMMAVGSKTSQFWSLVARNPDVVYFWFKRHPAWRVFEKELPANHVNLVPEAIWGKPFYLFVPILDSKVYVFGKEGSYNSSKEQFISAINNLPFEINEIKNRYNIELISSHNELSKSEFGRILSESGFGPARCRICARLFGKDEKVPIVHNGAIEKLKDDGYVIPRLRGLPATDYTICNDCLGMIAIQKFPVTIS